MIEVKVVNDEFVIKGSFALGIAGTYVNEEFGSDRIEILDTFEEVVEGCTEDGYCWGILRGYLKEKELTKENVAQAISDYYNDLEKKVQACIKQINSNLLIRVFENMIGCGLGFWDVEGAYIKEKMPNCIEEAYHEVMYEPHWEEIDKLYAEYDGTPNDNSQEKTDVEVRLRELFPMFNMDGLIAGVQPEMLSLKGKYISFQCSDSWNYEIMCSAYDRLDEKFCFTDWHNF